MKMIKWIAILLIMPITLLLGADGALMEWIGQSWKPIAGVLAFIAGGFYVPGVRFLLFAALKAAISGPVLKQLALEALKKYAKSTDTEVDDKLVEQFELRTRKIKGL